MKTAVGYMFLCVSAVSAAEVIVTALGAIEAPTWWSARLWIGALFPSIAACIASFLLGILSIGDKE